MIKWIKFKGSTEEEREKEINCKEFLLFRVWNQLNAKDLNQINFCDSTNYVNLLNFSAWAPANFPQEEKWEREYTFNTLMGASPAVIGDALNFEFDNLYSIVNQLKDDLRKR